MSGPVTLASSAPALGLEADIGSAHLWVHPEGGAWLASMWLGAWEHSTKRHATCDDAQRAAVNRAQHMISAARDQ